MNSCMDCGVGKLEVVRVWDDDYGHWEHVKCDNCPIEKDVLLNGPDPIMSCIYQDCRSTEVKRRGKDRGDRAGWICVKCNRSWSAQACPEHGLASIRFARWTILEDDESVQLAQWECTRCGEFYDSPV